MRVYRFESPPDKNNETHYHFLTPPASERMRQLPTYQLFPLALNWTPPRFEVVRTLECPDIFKCLLSDWAVPQTVVDAISSRTADDVEFLPIECDYDERLYLLHVLRLVELGPRAGVTVNPLSQNISSISRHDFDIEILSSCSLFRIPQTPGSIAANAGDAFRDIYATGDFADFLIESGFRGVNFVTVFESEG